MPSLAIIIPTRNRAALAIRACESLRNQPGAEYQVFVSDNSTQAEESERLAAYCASADGAHVTYLKPRAPLAMSTHWDWAIRTTMDRCDATHFNVHYDRRVTKPGHLSYLCDVMAMYPEDVITWTADVIVDDAGRSAVGQIAWDGRLYAVPTSRVVAMTVQGRIAEMGQAFPILSNCAVPRPVLLEILRRFGSICDSTAPDSSFTYRFCATHDRYLHMDRSLAVIYAFHRSTGSGFMRGAGGDFPDFMQSWGDRPWLDAAPIPGLNLGQNVLFHEYELVRRATDHPAFKPIEPQGYLRELADSLRWVEDPGRRAAFRNILLQHGWTPIEKRAHRVRDGWPWLRQFAIDASDNVIAWLLRRTRARQIRMSGTLFLARYLKITPDDICGFEFGSDEEAVAEAIAWPRRRSESTPFVAWLEGVDVLDRLPEPSRRQTTALRPV